MGLQVRYVGGSRAGTILNFPDEVEQVVIGRDPARCQIVFDPELTLVGREHCALHRELGRYRINVNRDDPVFVDGRRAVANQVLPASSEIQLGVSGPVLIVTTSLNPELPATLGKEYQPGTGTRLGAVESDARRSLTWAKWSSGAALLAGLIVILVSGRVNKITQQVLSLQQLSVSQRQLVDGLSQQFGVATQEINQLKSNFTESLNLAKESIYLVLIRDEFDHADPQATCWVVDRQKGVLATCGHVAELFDSLGHGSRMTIRGQGGEHEFTVRSAAIHPGYREFQALWDDYEPMRQLSSDYWQPVHAASLGCDVGLLFISEDDASKLMPALSVARNEDLDSLRAGEPVGYVGYPMENLSLGGVNLMVPNPIQQFGYITTVMNEFGDASAPCKSRNLIQHSLPTTGGASGSPILNRNGQVVAVHSAGNALEFFSKVQLEEVNDNSDSAGFNLSDSITVVSKVEIDHSKIRGAENEEQLNTKTARLFFERKRINSAANLNYAQRSNLVRELLDMTAKENQVARGQEWRSEIVKNFPDRKVSEKVAQFDKIAYEIADEFSANGEYRVSMSKVDELFDVELPRVDSANLAWERHLELLQLGKYVVFARNSNDHPIRLRLVSKSPELVSLSGEQHWGRWATQRVFLDVAEPTAWNVIATSTHETTGIRLYVWRLDRLRKTNEELHEQMVRNWHRSLQSNRASNSSTPIQRIRTEKVILPSVLEIESSKQAMSELNLPLKSPGNYLITLVGEEGSQFALELDPQSCEIHSKPPIGSSLCCSLRLKSGSIVRGMISSPKSGTKLQLSVYWRPET